MAVVLKISCQGQLHRILFGNMPDYADVDSAVEGLLPACQPYAVKYLDDEGDLCSLVEPTFADFLTMSKEAPSGQSVFHIEVFPLADAASTNAAHLAPCIAQPTSSGMRRHERPPKLNDVWEDDVRDLDELLKQFEEPGASNASSKKKKKKSKKPQPSQECWVQDPDAEALVEDDGDSGFGKALQPVQSERANIQEDAATVEEEDGDEEVSTQSVPITAKMDGAAEAFGEESAYETEIGEYETDVDASWEFDMVDSLDAEQCESDEAEMITLPRSASCPCFSAWQASLLEGDEGETGSLIERAWPFVDPDKVSVSFGSAHPNPGFLGQFDAIPPPESLSSNETNKISSGLNCELANPGLSDQANEHTPPPSAPCVYGYPQVVWMPVLINWAASEYASTLPGEGRPIDWARGMQVAQ